VLAVLALPLASSWFLHMGFYGFVAGIACALWATGYWIRHGVDAGPRHVAALSAILFLSYASHVIGALLALLLVAVIAVVRRDGGRAFPVAPLVAAAPTVLLIIGYLATAKGGGSFTYGGFRYLTHTIAFDPLIASFRSPERVISALLAATVWAGVAWSLWTRRERRNVRWTDALLALVPLSVLVGLFAPQEAAGGYIIPERLALIPALLLLLWLAAQEAVNRWLRPMLVVGAVLTVALAGLRVPSYREWADNVDEVTSVAAQIPPGSTVLPVTVLPYQDQSTFYRTEPTLYALSWIASEHGIVGLSNLDADTDYAPAVYREGLDPYRDIDTGRFSHEGTPVQVDLHGFDAAGGSIDYVLLIGREFNEPTDADTVAFLHELDANYEPIAESAPKHWVTLYRLRMLAH
jgi:hypothetical protein